MALPDYQVEVVTGGALPDYRVAVVDETATPRPDFYMTANVAPRVPDFRVAVVDENAVPRPDFRVWGLISNLGNLSVSPASITENSAPGAIVGAIVGAKAGSTVTITNTAGNRFAISGSNLVAGATNTDYETATSYDITLRETNASYPNSPKDTTLTIQVADVNTLLQPLSLSASTIAENSPAGTVVGAIQGASGGTVTITDTAGGRFAISGGNVVAGSTGTDYETATTHNITLTETLGESSNSPRNTVLAITVTDVAVEGPDFTGADLVLDFQNGYYKKGATTGTQPSDIGATNNGVITPGSGVVMGSGQQCSLNYSISGDFALVIDADIPNVNGDRYAVDVRGAGTGPGLLALLSNNQVYRAEYRDGAGSVSTLTPTKALKQAMALQSNVYRACGGGGAVQTVSAEGAQFASGVTNLRIGSVGAVPSNNWGFTIRSVAIYLGARNDAFLQSKTAP